MGCFSWIAQNSNRSIIMYGYGNRRYPCRTCYMWDNKGRRWRETEYEGYGIFGGKDFYILLAEMNYEYGPEIDDEQKRTDGINIYFSGNNQPFIEGGFLKDSDINQIKLVYPNLTDCKEWTWQNISPKSCFNQGSGDSNDPGSDNSDEDYSYQNRIKYTYENRIKYTKTDKFDGWENGEINPQLIVS